jgi:PERQ amino acid-rich with GYF domain-containing protein
VWSKPLASKTQAATINQPVKKTLAQIQKEEETRKQRLAAAAAAQSAAVNSAATSAGKRYADLASKAAAQPTTSGAWTMVGAGGKPKPSSTTPLGPRSTSGGLPITQVTKSRPVAPTRVPVTNNSASNLNRAAEELMKWAKMSLGRGLNSGINGKNIFCFDLFLMKMEPWLTDANSG